MKEMSIDLFDFVGIFIAIHWFVITLLTAICLFISLLTYIKSCLASYFGGLV